MGAVHLTGRYPRVAAAVRLAAPAVGGALAAGGSYFACTGLPTISGIVAMGIAGSAGGIAISGGRAALRTIARLDIQAWHLISLHSQIQDLNAALARNERMLLMASASGHAMRSEIETLEKVLARTVRQLQAHEMADIQRQGVGMPTLMASGGMAFTFLASPPGLHDENVVLKIPKIADEALYAKRFEREAAALAEVASPFVARFLGRVKIQGHLLPPECKIDRNAEVDAIIQEHVQGRAISEALSGGKKLERQEALRILIFIARGLVAIHSRGIEHRDIKPDNVVLDPQGIPKIIDFGLAKFCGMEIGDPEAREAVTSPQVGLTGRDTIVGTPMYMSLNSLMGKHGRPEDIYSFLIMAIQMLTGKAPYSDRTPRNYTEAAFNFAAKQREQAAKNGALVPLDFMEDSDSLKALFFQMAQEQSERRPTAEEVAVRLREIYYAESKGVS